MMGHYTELKCKLKLKKDTPESVLHIYAVSKSVLLKNLEMTKKNLKMSVGKKEKINVLSLFDGMSCGQIALNKLGIECDYYASEIKNHAIKVTQKTFQEQGF